MGKQKYIPRQRDRIEEVMGDHLTGIRLGDTVTAEASGPQLVPVQTPQGQTVGIGWQLTVYLAHDRLVGQEPIYVSVPVAGLLLDDRTIQAVAERALEEARNIRAKANNPKPENNGQPDAAAMMAALRKQAGNE